MCEGKDQDGGCLFLLDILEEIEKCCTFNGLSC